MKRNVIKCAFGAVCALMLMSCAKEVQVIETTDSESQFSDVLKFMNSEELQSFIEDGKQQCVATKSQGDFISLWDSQYMAFMETLDESVRELLLQEGLTYEPEDELIVDPAFAKVLNPKREIQVADKIYRYVHEGVVIYDCTISGDVIDAVNLSTVNMNVDEIQELSSGISFQKIVYRHLADNGVETRAAVMANASINNQGIVLGGGIRIPESNIRRVVYAQSESDANGFSKWVSGLFGTNVVAIKEFDAKHRIRLRTFSQDYGIYRSVGMAVRFQQKVLGSWFRYKAPEMRYGWTSVECIYRFRDPFREDLKNDICLIEKSIDGYPAPVLLFKSGLSNIKNLEISKAISSALSTNLFKNEFIAANASYKDNPRGIVAFDGTNSLRMLYPQQESIEYDDRREQVSWDFNWFSSSSIDFYRKNTSGQYERRNYALSPIHDITVNRGEFYAAVKYNDVWMACVIYNN